MWQFSTRFHFFFFEVVVINAWAPHDLPCHRTAKKYSDFPSMVIFSVAPAEILDSNMVLYFVSKYLCLFHIVFEYIPGIHDQGKNVGSSNSTSLLSTFHIGLIFCSFPANLMSSTYIDLNNPYSRCTNEHSQLETFNQPCFHRICSNCLSHYRPANGWPHKSFSRGTTGSSILDHDFGHFCRGRRIQMSGHSNMEFSTICEHLPFGPGLKQILHQLLVHRNLAIWIWYPWLLLPSFVILMIFVL